MVSDEPFEEEDGEASAPQSPSAVDPASQKRIRDRAKRERDEAAAFWESVFALEVGRREMWKILDSANTFRMRLGFGPTGVPSPEASWIYAGEKDVGFRLYLSWLAICPDGTTAMLKEHHPDLRPPPKMPRRPQDDRAWSQDDR